LKSLRAETQQMTAATWHLQREVGVKPVAKRNTGAKGGGGGEHRRKETEVVQTT